jgi:hypothetical protein
MRAEVQDWLYTMRFLPFDGGAEIMSSVKEGGRRGRGRAVWLIDHL